ncbi:MAG: hypothetical protein HY907_16515 [Deltaproteobacteria bacterium]|nr:hypothetical protein [Deltaproteobacteria bacterium]
MKRMRWILVLGAVTVGLAAGALGSCAIDDEITWINGEQCSGGCERAGAESFSCDTDDACTPTSTCTDWDCADDDAPPPEDAGTDTTREVPDAAADAGGDGDPYSDVTDPSGDADAETDEGTGFGCVPSGGGDSRETAVDLTLGVPLADLTACAAPSRWFRFTVAAGVRFEVDLVPAPEREVEFLLYAQDGSPVAGADMAADGDYNAAAESAGVFLLRVRAIGDGPVGYSLAVRELP